MKTKSTTKDLIKDLKKLAKVFAKESGESKENITKIYYVNNISTSKYSKYRYVTLFGDFSKFKKAAGYTEDDTITRDYFSGIVKKDKKQGIVRKYFVTAAMAGSSHHIRFLDTILNYCEVNNAELIVLPMRGIISSNEGYSSQLLQHSNHFAAEYIFNDKLRAIDFMLSPQQLRPLTGLGRLGHKDYSLIVASPKQQMIVVPTIHGSYPHLLHSTGTISNPDTYRPNRIGALGRQDHILGGIIVEIDKDDTFHIRQIQANANGSFIDLNKKYTHNNIININAKAIYAGDSHSGWEDQNAIKSTMAQIELLKPEYLLLGDILDCTSISHHHIDDIEAQVNRPEHLVSLEEELNVVGHYLMNIIDQFPDLKIVIIKSNHDEHLDLYLKQGRYVDDRMNYRLALELATYLIDGKNPIEEWMLLNYPNTTSHVTWLTRESSFKIAGIELAMHGDLGANGAYGSSASLELSYGNCVVGHKHSPSIFRGVWTVGTLSKLKLPYTKGPSSWMHTNCVIYKNGQRQLLNIIDGKYKL